MSWDVLGAKDSWGRESLGEQTEPEGDVGLDTRQLKKLVGHQSGSCK